jgi:hypothetical protein
MPPPDPVVHKSTFAQVFDTADRNSAEMSAAFMMVHPRRVGRCLSSRAVRAKSVFQVHGCNHTSPTEAPARSRHSSRSSRRAFSASRPARHRIAAAVPACVKVMDTLISNTTSQISNTRASNRPPRRVKVSTMRRWNCDGNFIGAYLAPTAMATIVARLRQCRP